MPTRSGCDFNTTMTQTNIQYTTPKLIEGLDLHDTKYFMDSLSVQDLYQFSQLLEKDE